MEKRWTAIAFVWAMSFLLPAYAIEPQTVDRTIQELTRKNPAEKDAIEKGVRQIARLWQEKDGDDAVFQTFCLEKYITDPVEKEVVFRKISDYMEAINGHFAQMSERLGWHVTVDTGPIHPVDYMFSTLGPRAHLTEDLYDKKIAFYVALNFPKLTLAEKEALGNDRRAWAYARLGDWFTSRIPTAVRQQNSLVSNDADRYIDAYNIYMGNLLTPKGRKLFPQEMILLCHWNLRDEIKANYNKGKEGLEKQQTVYEVMKRVISQEIPREAINSGRYDWNPYTNTLSDAGQTIPFTPESPERYRKMLNNFHAQQRIDQYMGDTYLDRKFNDEMEMALTDVEALFDRFLSAPELKEVGRLIQKRMGRKLQAFDIWYDGFKARANLDTEKLDQQLRQRYPDAQAMEDDLANILVKLGYAPERANYLAEKIAVDGARGSGHAAGASMKGQKARLRTRIPAGGMDYKGYNIAIHEFGHNVEQTISLYDVDYYLLEGVPNTAFTEALAFVFQKRDLEILGIDNNDPEKNRMDLLDKVWSLYEIAGVSMLDIAVWKWLYAHPEATAVELQEAVVALSKEVWNRYYAPVFGVKDETVLAIYSHMIGYPLYLSAYAFGQIIEYQLENYFAGKHFATEVDRIFALGCLTPNVWIQQATGSPLTVDPLLENLRKALEKK
ncbi:hypothetical protein [Parabacteroides sp. PF5-6]|uniref:hypothetical protein n=1 Tax=Parabacteroides sp. PF5-6 TaxID=1742403 RepID=UPI0024057791|nr:hypothetical protein [Parabacteroides sp. PF5-6]